MLTFDVPIDFQVGKPEFPDILEKTKLVDLVGPNTWFIFLKLKVNSDWLRKSADLWPEDSDYKLMETFVRTVKTPNDTAERGVKLMSDYALILTKDESMKQYILQVVDSHRKAFPDFKKKTLNSE